MARPQLTTVTVNYPAADFARFLDAIERHGGGVFFGARTEHLKRALREYTARLELGWSAIDGQQKER